MLYIVMLCLGIGVGSSLHAENKEYGSQSMVKRLKKVLVRRPDASFAVNDPAAWHYTDKPDLEKAKQEHDAFVDILRNHGVEIVYHEAVLPNHADAIFVHDPVIITDHGAIMVRMGKALREGEEAAMQETLEKLRIPLLGSLTGGATAEGGDILWLDESTLVIGRGFRTNQEGIDQIKALVEPLGITVLVVELPYFQGRDACLHLQSLISLIDEKVAVVYLPLLSTQFVQLLIERGFHLIEIDEQEFCTMGSNILTIAPGVCVTLAGNNRVRAALESMGVMVYCYQGNEISLKAEGGATCLTRPLLRD